MSYAQIDAEKVKKATKEVINDIFRMKEKSRKEIKWNPFARESVKNKYIEDLYRQKIEKAEALLSLAENAKNGFVFVNDEDMRVLKNYI